MRFVVIEEKILEELLSSINGLIVKFERTFNTNHSQGPKGWLDTQDVCMLLSISKRGVQNLRSSGKLPSTKIGKKSYYKPEDVQKLITYKDDK